MPKPQITGQDIQNWAKHVSEQSMHVSSVSYYDDVVKKRYLGQNTNIGAFINAYFMIKLMAINFPYADSLGHDANQVMEDIHNKFELDLPLDEWLSQMLVEGTREEKVVGGGTRTVPHYSLDENKILDVNVDNIFEKYGTKEIKDFYQKHPDKLDSMKGLKDVTINLKSFNDVARMKDAKHDLDAKNWQTSKQQEIDDLQSQEEDRIKQVEEDVKPENWKKFNVGEESKKLDGLNTKQDVFGMYAKVRQKTESRRWFDVLFHPIDSYRENKMRKGLEQKMMSEYNVEKDGLDSAYELGVSYVQKEIRDSSHSLQDDIDKAKEVLSDGYDKFLESKNTTKKIDDFNKQLGKDVNGPVNDMNKGSKVSEKNDPTKKIEVNGLKAD